MLSFSTCWNNSRHGDGESMIEEIVGLGFTNIELSHGMTIAKLPGIARRSPAACSPARACTTISRRRSR